LLGKDDEDVKNNTYGAKAVEFNNRKRQRHNIILHELFAFIINSSVMCWKGRIIRIKRGREEKKRRKEVLSFSDAC
jgi:hypothetical protein